MSQEVQNRDSRVYRWAGLTLTVGMYASFAAMSVGLVWWLLAGAPGGAASASKTIPFDRLLADLGALNPLALLNVGVLLLLATPAVTLLAQIVAYALERNRLYAGVASLVGAVLLLSLAISLKWIVLF